VETPFNNNNNNKKHEITRIIKTVKKSGAELDYKEKFQPITELKKKRYTIRTGGVSLLTSSGGCEGKRAT
jgi:hypothetical protein